MDRFSQINVPAATFFDNIKCTFSYYILLKIQHNDVTFVYLADDEYIVLKNTQIMYAWLLNCQYISMDIMKIIIEYLNNYDDCFVIHDHKVIPLDTVSVIHRNIMQSMYVFDRDHFQYLKVSHKAKIYMYRNSLTFLDQENDYVTIKTTIKPLLTLKKN